MPDWPAHHSAWLHERSESSALRNNKQRNRTLNHKGNPKSNHRLRSPRINLREKIGHKERIQTLRLLNSIPRQAAAMTGFFGLYLTS